MCVPSFTLPAVMVESEIDNSTRQLESLSLALSHRLPPVLDSHRPAIPAWALPTAKLVETPGEEEENDEHKEGVAYWVEVKEILDREAEERVVLRRKQWEKISNVTSK